MRLCQKVCEHFSTRINIIQFKCVCVKSAFFVFALLTRNYESFVSLRDMMKCFKLIKFEFYLRIYVEKKTHTCVWNILKKCTLKPIAFKIKHTRSVYFVMLFASLNLQTIFFHQKKNRQGVFAAPFPVNYVIVFVWGGGAGSMGNGLNRTETIT